MTLISSSIPNFVNGVSQQPFTLRLSSQGDLQENGLSTVSSGLRKRPPTEHLAKIGVTPLADAFVHLIDRDGLERYQVVVTNGDLKVYDLAGVEKVVTFTNKPYLNTVKPADQSFALTTVADYTFIVNRTKVAAANATLGAVRPFEALYNVKLGNYGKTYAVLVNGAIVASYTTPNGATTADAPMLSTEFIATQLMTALTTAGYNTAPWVSTRHGSVIYLKHNTTDFTVSAEDGFSGTALVAIKRRLQKFSDLPANPRVNGFTVEIIGEQASDFDNYWVTFDGQGSDNSSGVWRESVQPGLSLGLDANTMPHQLVRESSGAFTFRPAVWTARSVGDALSNPHPSFVGRTINDIFFFQNRLGFLSDENFVQTETGKYFNCYRTTVNALLDSDPVDVNAATNKVAVLEHAVSFDRQLILFSRQQQFVVDSGETMSPKKVPIKPSTNFAVSTRAKPAVAGRNVYFATDKGNWSAVRELFVEQAGTALDAADVTAHVPKYVPANIVKIAAGPNEDTLAILSASDRTRLFIYRYYFSGSEKLQSSWSTFSIPAGGTILNIDFIGSVLYLIVSRTDGVYFEKIDFSLGAAVAGEPYQVLLDRKVIVGSGSLTYSAVTNLTTINPAALGYTPDVAGEFVAVAHGGGLIKAGQLFFPTAPGLAVFQGNLTASNLSFGRKYLFRYTLSTLTIKTPAPGGGTISDTEGRTQVRRIAFNHSETGYYKVKVTPEARQTYTYIFAGKSIGASSSAIGSQVLTTNRFISPVMGRNTHTVLSIESDMPLPVAILSADWEAFYVKRSRPV